MEGKALQTSHLSKPAVSNQRIIGVEWAGLQGQRPRKPGSNACLGEHGIAIHVPILRVTTEDGARGFGACYAAPERAAALLGQGDWPSRSLLVAKVTASLHDAARHDAASWFLIGRDGAEAVAMALIHPFRASGGSGDVILGTSFLSLIYVLPNRWGKGIGGISTVPKPI